jgi:hypothetical protein
MAVGMFRSVDNVKRKIKKRYRSVGNVTHEVKKRWRSVDNVTRLTFQNSLVLFDNGITDYVWTAGTVQGSILKANYNGIVSLSSKIDLSGFTKCYVTFKDSTISTSTYPNAIVYFQSAEVTDNRHHLGYTRESGAVMTVCIDISDVASKLKNTSPIITFSLWKSDWLNSIKFEYAEVYKIWFE